MPTVPEGLKFLDGSGYQIGGLGTDMPTCQKVRPFREYSDCKVMQRIGVYSRTFFPFSEIMSHRSRAILYFLGAIGLLPALPDPFI